MATKKRWKINWTTDKIMSTSALFISVISLIALLYQSYLAREEYKLIQQQQSASVLPHLNQWYSNNNESFKLIIGNKGVGPAFIKSVELTLDGSKTFNNSDDLFKDIFSNSSTLDTIPSINSTLIKGLVLTANEMINVIEIKGRKNIAAFRKEFETKDINFNIIYEDVYGAQWLLTNQGGNDNAPIPISKD